MIKFNISKMWLYSLSVFYGAIFFTFYFGVKSYLRNETDFPWMLNFVTGIGYSCLISLIVLPFSYTLYEVSEGGVWIDRFVLKRKFISWDSIHSIKFYDYKIFNFISVKSNNSHIILLPSLVVQRAEFIELLKLNIQ